MVCYKVYSYDARERLCTQAEGMVKPNENFSIHPAPCRKNPIKK